MPKVFTTLLQSQKLVGEKDIVAIDFSDFGNGFQVLMFAKQTRKGRAVPLYFEIIRYPIDEGSQNIFIIETIQHFTEIVGCKPILIFDRGFTIPTLIDFLAQHKYIFIIRIKKGKSAHGLSTNRRFLVIDNSRIDRVVLMYQMRLRLITADQLEEMTEPWYLITNDFHSLRKKIIDRYYHRFEIEEFFRDAKRLLNLEQVRCEKLLSLTITLWFAMLGVWFCAHVENMVTETDQRAQAAMQLSRVRYLFEKIQWLYITQTEGEYMALDKVRKGG